MSKYQLGDWAVDTSRGLLLNDTTEVQVEPKCMDLLILLIRAEGELVSRKEIMDSLWNGRYVSEHALNNVVAMLRKHLNNGDDRNYITTQPKRGYVLSVKATPIDVLPTNETVIPTPTKSLAKPHLHIPIIALSLLVCIAIALVTFAPNDQEAQQALVVFPFSTIDEETDSAIFAQGLYEEINHHLSSYTNLMLDRTSESEQTRQNGASYLFAARQLNVGYFVEGSIRAERNALRITARLFDAKTGEQLWSNVYTANSQDMLSSQNSVSRKLTKAIGESLTLLQVSNELDQVNFKEQRHWQRQNQSERADSSAIVISSNAADFFTLLANDTDPSQSIANEWQLGMYNNNVFELFDYSGTTLLNRPSIVGWVNKGFHAGFLNIGDGDEIFPGNSFKSRTLVLHPGHNGLEAVLRYLVPLTGEFTISAQFVAIDSIECLRCTSDGVHVSIRVNGQQLGDAQYLLGFGDTTTHTITESAVALRRGDIVDFIVMPRSTLFDDATKVKASVSWIAKE